MKGVNKMKREETLRKEILEKVKEYYTLTHKKEDFKKGDWINYGGRIYDENEMMNLVESSLDFWLTSGKYVSEFEKKFSEFLGVKYCSLTNSGSSANLLAFMALTSPKLEEKRIKKGDEVITVAAGFPTTIAPIVQYGAIPVFVDIKLPQYNIDVTALEKARSEKTKAVMIAHTLGNPFDLKAVKEFCSKYDLWLVEDNCDALGSKYFYEGRWQYTGTIGDIGTSSFYPPHHITMGEGGAVYTNNLLLKRIVDSFRDWGRDCCCPSGVDNFCKRRFLGQHGKLPFGYDHKYVYSHLGYNLKVTEMQASIGLAQLEKLPDFIQKRRANWRYLRDALDDLKDVIILPEEVLNGEASWFGFLITIKENAGFTRDEMVRYLEEKHIQTRMLFAGNMVKQPCFNEITDYRIVGELTDTDTVMMNTFWVGVYPGMNKEKLQYMSDIIHEFIIMNRRAK